MNTGNYRTYLLDIKDKRISTSVKVDETGKILEISPMLKKYIGQSIFLVNSELNGKLRKL